MLLPSFLMNGKGDLHRTVATAAQGNDQVFEVATLTVTAFCGLGVLSNFILFIISTCGWPAKRRNHWTCYLQVIAIVETLTLAFFAYRYVNEFFWPDGPNLPFMYDFTCRLFSYAFNWIRLVDNWVVVALTIDSYMAMFTTLRLFGGEIGDRRIGWLIISIIGIAAALLLIPDVILVRLFDSRSHNTAARALFNTGATRFAVGIPITESCWSGIVPYEIGYRQVGVGLIVGFLIPFCCVFTMNVTILKYANRKIYKGSAQSRHGRQFLSVTFFHMFAQLPLACFSVYTLIVRHINPSQTDNEFYRMAEFLAFEVLPMIAYAGKLYMCVVGSREFRKCCCSNRHQSGLAGRPGDDGIRRLGGLLSTGPQHHALLEEQDISTPNISSPKKHVKDVTPIVAKKKPPPPRPRRPQNLQKL